MWVKPSEVQSGDRLLNVFKHEDALVESVRTFNLSGMPATGITVWYQDEMVEMTFAIPTRVQLEVRRTALTNFA